MDSGSDENSDPESRGKEENQPKEVRVPIIRPLKIYNKTSILLARSHDDKSEETECSYCNGKRLVDDPMTGEKGLEEANVTYHKLGFTSTKLKADDLEHFLDSGFTRCGTYIYQRNSRMSCCEIYQYRVLVDKFKMTQS